MKWELPYNGHRRVKRKFAFIPVKCDYSRTLVWLESYFACQEFTNYTQFGKWTTAYCTQDIDITKEFMGEHQ